jgi:hypothetical protein
VASSYASSASDSGGVVPRERGPGDLNAPLWGESPSQTIGQKFTGTRRLFFLVPSVFFGAYSVANLVQGHYYSAYWYALPTVASILVVASPAQTLAIRSAGTTEMARQTNQRATHIPWQTLVWVAAVLVWFLSWPTAAVLRRTVEDHDLAVLLAVVVPTLVAVVLVALMRGPLSRVPPRSN